MEIGKKRWVALFMSMIALCLVLAGCASGGAGGGADAAKSFIGDWKLVGMEENGEATSSEDIALMEQMGVTGGQELHAQRLRRRDVGDLGGKEPFRGSHHDRGTDSCCDPCE